VRRKRYFVCEAEQLKRLTFFLFLLRAQTTKHISITIDVVVDE